MMCYLRWVLTAECLRLEMESIRKMRREHEIIYVGMSWLRHQRCQWVASHIIVLISWLITPTLRKAVSAMPLLLSIADCVEKDIAVQRIGFRSQ